MVALVGAAAACAALPSLVSGAATSEEPKRMTGAGERLLAPAVAVRYVFDVRCGAARPRAKLGLRWGSGERFRLTRLDSVTCIDDLNVGSSRPAARFDTLMGRGRGRYNGRPGAEIRFRFVDLGPRGDLLDVRVRRASGERVLSVDGRPNRGDHRAR